MPQSVEILVLDDDWMMREFTERALQKLEHSSVSTSNGTEALALLRQTPTIGVLIADLKLGGEMGGAEVVQTALAERPDLGVLLISGDPVALHEAFPDALPNVIRMAKPFRRRDLEASLARLLE